MKRFLALLAALALLVPGAALGSGTWRVLTAEISEDEKMIPASDFTGEITMTFLGDCTLGGTEDMKNSGIGFERIVKDNGMAYPFRNLVRLTGEDDLTVANLEGVLSDRNLAKVKKKFNFKGPAAFTEILTLGSVECVTLANNHSHDYGDKGYADTKEALNAAGICWFAPEAPAMWVSDEGLRIGFLGVDGNLSGSRSKQYERMAQRLRDYGCAAVITVMHAGTEYSYDPPDGYQKQITGRAAPVSDLIVGHHPHVVQGFDVLNGVPVVYSLGNCVFGGNTRPKDFDALALQAVLRFEEGSLKETELRFRPLSVTGNPRRNDYSPVLLSGEDALRVLKKMKESTGNDPGEWDEERGAGVTVAAK